MPFLIGFHSRNDGSNIEISKKKILKTWNDKPHMPSLVQGERWGKEEEGKMTVASSTTADPCQMVAYYVSKRCPDNVSSKQG